MHEEKQSLLEEKSTYEKPLVVARYTEEELKDQFRELRGQSFHPIVEPGF
ncbi:MAG: hypothetical protein HZA78_12490 [Candidatus Schekmanbacteria bacterium]|nr:hypothetical protein [Candidatus Schekmanbacteria bacterium]